MIASIYKYGSSVLRKKSIEIDEKEDFVLLSASLFETLSNSTGIGLAGPQIGVLKRIFVIDTSLITQKDNSFETIKQVYINPSIIWSSDELIVYSEGCLSIPEIYEEVERPERIRVKYHDLQFNRIEKELEGLEARIFQHEFDHLNGVLFIDRINPLKRIQLASKLKKIVKASKK